LLVETLRSTRALFAEPEPSDDSRYELCTDLDYIRFFEGVIAKKQQHIPSVIDDSAIALLSNHIGGLPHLQSYLQRFGPPSEDYPFGSCIAVGLSLWIKDNYWPHVANRKFADRWRLGDPHWNPDRYVPWFGVFQSPLHFSKHSAAEGLSPFNPRGHQQYPAIFYLPPQMHRERIGFEGSMDANNIRAMINSVAVANPNVHENANCVAIKLSPSMHADDTNYMDSLKTWYQNKDVVLKDGTALIETRQTPGNERIIMVCVKIAVGQSPPWWVHPNHIRLIAPISRL
jgi:hypothetical protein